MSDRDHDSSYFNDAMLRRLKDDIEFWVQGDGEWIKWLVREVLLLREELHYAEDKVTHRLRRISRRLDRLASQYSPPEHCCPSCACPEYDKPVAEEEELRAKIKGAS